MKMLLLLCLAALLSATSLSATELILAENKKCDYQIVTPDRGDNEIVDRWLSLAARLTQAAFAKNGCSVAVTAESSMASDKPAIYLGATRFAKAHGIHVEQHDDWTYYCKVVGKDLIIAGNDKPDPIAGSRSKNPPLALLGTVKGMCDFLREYAGVRFIFMNFEQGISDLGNDGSLKIDPRSIAFLPTARIAVPDTLDLKNTPMMRASYDSSHETLFNIANNFFPALGSIQGAEVVWYKVIPPALYGKSHPEYFALTKDGQRACDLKLGFDDHMEICPTNPGVQDLMFAEMEKQILHGAKIIHMSTMDGFRLSSCNCRECNKLFGIKAESWDQIHARGRSGKLWQAFFRVTERVRAKYPAVRIVLLNYQDTPISADIVQRFPENVIPKIQFASQRDFDGLKGVEFPAGVCGFEETFTGFGQAGPYLPERTPEHMAEVVQTLARNNVKWSMRDGSLGYVRGMQAPAYYVYGRMMDDPAADWRGIYDEFCTAAFGEVSVPMKQFFELLDKQLAVYSDFFGVFMPAWDRKYSRSTYHDSKWHVMSMYPPEYCADADTLLTRAEKGAQDPDVKARLHLIRIEFDYIRKMSRIFFLQNAWTMNPSQANLCPLLDAIDEWHAGLEKLSGPTGRSSFRPLEDWPEMRPFGGHFYVHAALQTEGYQQQWNKTCLNWDTKAIRAGILTDKHQLKVGSVDAVPALDSKVWEAVPQSVFKVRGGMPFSNVTTHMRVLRDQENLYVRIESLFPAKHPEDLYKKAPDKDVFSQEYVELAIRPPGSGSKVYRLAANPVEGSRYDSVFAPGKRNLMTEDVSWNGKWEFGCATTLEKGVYNLPERVWTAWFKIPFSDFQSTPPAPGEVWGFNAARNRTNQYMLWNEATSVTDAESLGKLEF